MPSQAEMMELVRLLQATEQPPVPNLTEAQLSPGQMVGLQRSRDVMNSGKGTVNPDGSFTSFMGAISDAPGGGYMNYPTYWNGQVMSPRNAQGIALDYENQTGKQFARYPTVQAAETGEQAVHKIMSRDATDFLSLLRGK